MNLIDRDLLLRSLKECDIPVTKSEREIIKSMPLAGEQEDKKFRELKRKIKRKNRPFYFQHGNPDDELVQID